MSALPRYFIADAPEPRMRPGPTDRLLRRIDTLRDELDDLRAEIAELKESGTDTHKAHALVLPKYVVVEAHEVRPDQGFYALEQAEDGTVFRWTGPTPRFAFDVSIDRKHETPLELRAINFIDFERQKDLQLFVEGEAVPAEIERGGNGVVVRATLAPRSELGTTRIVVALPMTLAPANTDDTRQLGLAFTRLSLGEPD